MATPERRDAAPGRRCNRRGRRRDDGRGNVILPLPFIPARSGDQRRIWGTAFDQSQRDKGKSAVHLGRRRPEGNASVASVTRPNGSFLRHAGRQVLRGTGFGTADCQIQARSSCPYLGTDHGASCRVFRLRSLRARRAPTGQCRSEATRE